MIPQANPRAAYLAQQQEIDEAVARILNSGWYLLGEEVKAFEVEFAAWGGLQNVVGVANGTDAIVLALRALEIGAGDEVITTPHTASATVAAIELAGATPVLVD
ncbi:MAG: DegT/DnrJ/EryC1/StrS family aminotransferase, partial [Chloroflexota bacterium]